MKEIATQLLQDLENELKSIIPLIDVDPFEYCPKALEILLKKYDALRSYFIHQKLNEKEEIHFFKNIKPKITCQIIYFNELFIIETNKPVGSDKTIRKYYNTQLKLKEQFFVDHADFYRYFKRGYEYLDTCYFLRNQQVITMEYDSFFFQIDKDFATTHDYKAAQIIANEQLQHYLISKLKAPLSKVEIQLEKPLKWTGSKVGIIELIYALHTEGVFNYGRCDVKDIVTGFSKIFDIDLGQFHRTFYEIAARKSNRTKFMSTLNENLMKRLEHTDA